MRLTVFEALDDLRTAFPRMQDAVAPKLRAAAVRADEFARRWLDRAQARLSPASNWFGGKIAKNTRLKSSLAAVAGTWDRLVDTFCATIAPYMSRWYPELRLVATVTRSGELALTRTLKNDAVENLGVSAAFDEDTRRALATGRWTAVELRLREDQVLRRALSMPGAGRDFLTSIIAHKLERLTPWRPDRVLYGFRIATESEGTLAIELFATSKDIVAAPLHALEELGLAPTAIGLDEAPATVPLTINLLQGAPKVAHIDSRRVVSRVALATFAATGAIWLASLMWASSAEEMAQIAGTRLVKARRLLKAATMGGIAAPERGLLEANSPERSVVVLVDKLAKAIPADTYLKELSIAPDKVRIVGATTNAPALVGEIEATGLRNVRFTSAVTREKDARDSFEISADRLTPLSSDAP